MLADMGLTVVASGREARLAVFWHGPGEPAVSLDWWSVPCLVFTEYGSWSVLPAQATPRAGLPWSRAGPQPIRSAPQPPGRRCGTVRRGDQFRYL
jgi:hypothetical protein